MRNHAPEPTLRASGRGAEPRTNMQLPILSALFEPVPEDPFYLPRRPLWLPREMSTPPPLPSGREGGRVTRKYAVLVNPFYPKDPHGSFGKHVLTPSLALTSVAAATLPGWRIECWDENHLQGSPPAAPLPEVAGISVHLTFASRAYALADWYRRQGTRVVLGGLHVQSCPEEAAAHADAIAVGDGVQLWPQILQDVDRSCLRSRYDASYERSYDLDPVPRRDLVDRREYLTTLSLIATRGCHNRCGFCYMSTTGIKMPYRVRSAEDICAQIKASGEPYVVFIDNNLGSDRGYLWALTRALQPLRIIWSAAVSLDVTDDPKLIEGMARSGCTGVFIGLETLSDENLARARKRTPRTAEYARRVQLFHEQGIAVNGSFVLGFDGDDKGVFHQTAEWIEANRLECATFHILTPYPGTPLFQQLEAEGRLLHRDWSKYDTAHVVFRPKRMTPEELALGYDWLYRRLFSPGSIWRRRPARASSVLPYLALCLLYKRSNRLWHWLIRHRLVHAVWRPFVAWTRWRHLARVGHLKRPISNLADATAPPRAHGVLSTAD